MAYAADTDFLVLTTHFAETSAGRRDAERQQLRLAVRLMEDLKGSSRTTTALRNIVREDLMIPSDTAGIGLHLRNKRPRGLTAFSPDRTVVLMHGATFPAESLFEYRSPDVPSWMFWP